MANIGHRRSVAVTLFVIMVAVAIVPLAIMAIQGYHCAAMAVVQLQTAHLNSVLGARKLRIEDWLRERQAELSSIASYPCTMQECIRSSQTEGKADGAVCQLLDNAHSRSDAYESLVLYSLDWQRMNASKQSVHTDEKMLHLHFLEALTEATTPTVTAPHFHESGMIGIHMGCPVYGESGVKVGFMVSVLDLSATVYPILDDRTGFGKTTRTYIVSSDGRYFSQPSEGVHLLEERAPLPDVLLAGESDEPQEYRNGMGKTVIGVSTSLPELGWVLIAEIDRSEAFAWLTSLRRRAVATGIFTLSLVIFLAFRSAHKVTVPLRKLAAVARDISAGNFEKRLGALRGREPQDVAIAFNSMLDKLSVAHSELVQSTALAAIGELSSSIVHEMRNPLSSVKMNLKALQEKVADDPTYAELAEIASGQVGRLEQMLNDLLQYGKPLELHRVPLTFKQLVEDVSLALAGLSSSNCVGLRFEDDTNGRVFTGDREQLGRALGNLIDNAIRASSADCGIDVVGMIKEENGITTLVFYVDDSGSGITESVQPRLFEPFFTTKRDGTGLGLASVRKIVELHGGTVMAENRTKGGARFTVKLPLREVS